MHKGGIAVLAALTVVAIGVFLFWQSQEPTGTSTTTALQPGRIATAEVSEPLNTNIEAEEPAPAEPPVVVDAECANRDLDGARRSKEEIEQDLQDAMAIIEVSSDPEHLLAAAMISMGSDHEHSIELFRRLGGEKATHPVALWSLMNLCEQRPSIECDYDAIARTVRAQQSANGAFWLSLAGGMLNRGRDDAAYAALSQALAAPVIDTMGSEQVALVERALAASTDWSYAERIYHSVDHTDFMPSAVQRIMERCESDPASQWSLLCDQLINRLLENDRDLVSRVLGLELKTRVLDARGDEEGLALVREQKDELTDVVGPEDAFVESMNALLNDEILLRNFLENLDANGELAAFGQLTDDVGRLKTTKGYDQCNFKANPYVEL